MFICSENLVIKQFVSILGCPLVIVQKVFGVIGVRICGVAVGTSLGAFGACKSIILSRIRCYLFLLLFLLLI
jgi:hypothetical protein